MPLKLDLLKKGHQFKSETDTEVVAHLMADQYNGNFEETVRKVLHIIQGSYSLVFLCAKEPDEIICAKKNNPLVIGLGKGGKLYCLRYSGHHQQDAGYVYPLRWGNGYRQS